MKPMFYFYGGKWRSSPRYPAPTYGKIIEPFAGGANYSLRHHWLDVDLYELDPYLAGIWDFLIGATPADILALPTDVTHVDDLTCSQEAKWFIGMWLNKGVQTPKKSPSKWMRSGTTPNSFWGEATKERIAGQVSLIDHWTITHGGYEKATNEEATWFIDPPYDNPSGKLYRFSDIDYGKLSEWCYSRWGQTIVCENVGADWLPFEPLYETRHSSPRGKVSKEAVWHSPDDTQLPFPVPLDPEAVSHATK